MRTVTVYQPTYANGAPSPVAFVTRREAERIVGGHVREVPFRVGPDQFWAGDTIAVELYRGATETHDGVFVGGGWQPETVGYADPWTVNLDTGEIQGAVRELGTDRHIQAMPLRERVDGFPYRNARLVRRNEVDGV